jgi:thiamine-phosphate pyrophosphorylase
LRDFLPKLERALESADVACLLIAAPTSTSDPDLFTIAQPLIQTAQARNVAVLLPDRAPLAKQLGADGVHLDFRATSIDDAVRVYRYARKTLADDAIVGALCPPERHLALEVAEAGADYVGFDLSPPDGADVIAWWGEMMTVPCVAFGRVDPATAAHLARSGADFIAPELDGWNSVDPASDLAALQAAIRAG